MAKAIVNTISKHIIWEVAMKKEIVNFFTFLSVIIIIILTYLFLYPLKLFDKAFKTKRGNLIIDRILWSLGGSLSKF